MEYDRIDIRIIALLQSDGRITNADLAAQVGLSPSACLRRVQRLEETGVVEGYTAQVNPQMVGRPTSVFVEVRLERQSEDVLDAFEAAVENSPEVMECYLMSGNADYLLRLAVADTADYERVHRQFLARLPGVANIRSSFAIRAVRRNNHLLPPPH